MKPLREAAERINLAIGEDLKHDYPGVEFVLVLFDPVTGKVTTTASKLKHIEQAFVRHQALMAATQTLQKAGVKLPPKIYSPAEELAAELKAFEEPETPREVRGEVRGPGGLDLFVPDNGWFDHGHVPPERDDAPSPTLFLGELGERAEE